MPLARVILSLYGFAAVALLGGCAGQTGSEPAGIPDECMCVAAGSFIYPPLHGTVLELSVDETVGGGVERTATVRIDGPVGDGYPADIQIGAQVGGRLNPCGLPSLAAGDTVRAFYARGVDDGHGCPERIACVQTECFAPLDRAPPGPTNVGCQQQCAEQTATACAARAEEARNNGHIWLARWETGSWDFGIINHESRVLSDDDLSVLADTNQCFARFPIGGADQ